MTHFLQSSAWESFQTSLGRTSIHRSGTDWSYRAFLEVGSGNSRLYTPYGPTVTSSDALSEAISSLRKEATAHNVTFIRIEPDTDIPATTLRGLGFKPVTYQQLNPAHTQIIDLSPTPDELLAAMSQNSRNLTRNYAKKGLTITQTSNPDDISILIELLAGVAVRNRITPHSSHYFKTQAQTLFPIGAASLFYVSLENKPIAAALVYDSSTTRYYAHAAADDTYRKLSAGTALVGHMILDAKSRGLHHFDLYGIAPEGHTSDHPWAGFTKFKQSFGGEAVSYIGAWDLPLKRLPYLLYRTYQTLRSLRK